MSIRIAVIDDQELVRHGFAVMLSLDDDIEVVGQAADGFEAIDLVRQSRPDVILMDVNMPEMDGLEATRRILGDPTLSRSRILILTTFDADEYVYEALRAGASGFLLKDTSPEDLIHAIRIVAGGEAMLAPKITSRLIARFAAAAVPRPDLQAGVEALTDREREVFDAVARGLSNAEVADKLNMSYGTVKTHVSHLLTKLGCNDRAQLVVAAYESGFVTPGRAPR